MINNRRWLLAARPEGMVAVQHFSEEVEQIDEAALGQGEVLVKVLVLSFDPAMRGWMDDVPSYLPPVGLGEPMRASGVGVVVKSNREGLGEGALVQGFLGWQEYYLSTQEEMVPLNVLPEGTPPAMALSVFGGTSLTAYFGLLDVGQPVAGETVVVSGAAGATGSIAAQIAKIKGCRVVGIAGGEEKCSWLISECKLDQVIDYKSQDFEERFAECCSAGIDVFFDNVGGRQLELAIEHIAERGRIVLCGQIASYNSAVPQPGPSNMFRLITQLARMQGFILLDYLERFPQAMDELVSWVMNGDIAYREDIQQGFDEIPATFLRLFAGANRGKQLLELADG